MPGSKMICYHCFWEKWVYCRMSFSSALCRALLSVAKYFYPGIQATSKHFPKDPPYAVGRNFEPQKPTGNAQVEENKVEEPFLSIWLNVKKVWVPLLDSPVSSWEYFSAKKLSIITTNDRRKQGKTRVPFHHQSPAIGGNRCWCSNTRAELWGSSQTF